LRTAGPTTQEGCDDGHTFQPQIDIYPISARLVTAYNKEIQEDNEKLRKQCDALTEQMNEMRRNYHKDLNNNENFEAQVKKRMEAGSRNRGGVLGVSDELLDSIENNTHFFEATDNIPADVKQLLNNKIQKIKGAFEKSAISQMKYVEGLNKKIYLYESMSSEFHALIEMPLGDIFRGL
jgi:hypothetical protein